MASEPDASGIERDEERGCYRLTLNGEQATLDYHFEGGCMVITHTFVPPALRGGGIAAGLVRAALADARRTGHKVRSQCSYVTVFLQRHAAEYADLSS